MSTPVTDGRATIPLDTDGLTEGRYKIHVEYTDGNYYNDTSVENSILTLEPVTGMEIGVGTTNPFTLDMIEYYNNWGGTKITPTLTSNGGLNSGQNYRVLLKEYPLTDNYRLTIRATNNTNNILVGISPRQNEANSPIEYSILGNNLTQYVNGNTYKTTRGTTSIGTGTHILVFERQNNNLSLTIDDTSTLTLTDLPSIALYPCVRADNGGLVWEYCSIEYL